MISKALTWGPSQSVASIGITPLYTVGWMLAISGGLLRLLCYRTLGRFFTFVITLRPKHQLITQGPYSIVRHPAYTASTIASIGITLCQGSAGSWVRESGLMNTSWGKRAVYGWSVLTVYMIAMVWMRIPQEDRMLRREFGEQWDKWAANVPYRVFPGIY